MRVGALGRPLGRPGVRPAGGDDGGVNVESDGRDPRPSDGGPDQARLDGPERRVSG